MQNTMRAHSAGQISIEGGVDVNKGHMVYTFPTNFSAIYLDCLGKLCGLKGQLCAKSPHKLSRNRFEKVP